MRSLLVLLTLFVCSVWAEGPILRNKDSVTQQEFDNVYSDLRTKVTTTVLTSNTSGQFLLGQGNGVNPVWSFSGRVLQVVEGTVVSAATSTTTTAFVQSGIKASITPKQTGSTIAVIANVAAFRNTVAGDTAYSSIFRNGSNLGLSSTDAMAVTNVSATVTSITTAPMVKFDHPNTGSAVTYEIYFKTDAGGTAVLSGSGLDAQVMLVEIGS